MVKRSNSTKGMLTASSPQRPLTLTTFLGVSWNVLCTRKHMDCVYVCVGMCPHFCIRRLYLMSSPCFIHLTRPLGSEGRKGSPAGPLPVTWQQRHQGQLS